MFLFLEKKKCHGTFNPVCNACIRSIDNERCFTVHIASTSPIRIQTANYVHVWCSAKRVKDSCLQFHNLLPLFEIKNVMAILISHHSNKALNMCSVQLIMKRNIAFPNYSSVKHSECKNSKD